MSGEAFANAALKEHGWEVAGYFVALVTRRDDQMRMELLEQAFNERKANTAIEVAPGVMRKEKVELPASLTWQGEKSIYLPYPASDTQLNPKNCSGINLEQFFIPSKSSYYAYLIIN